MLLARPAGLIKPHSFCKQPGILEHNLIPAFWMQRQRDCRKFQVILDYIARSCLKDKTNRQTKRLSGQGCGDKARHG